MTRLLRALAAACAILAAAAPAAPAPSAGPDAGATYVIPIEDTIERGLLYIVRRGMAEASREKAGMIVFAMNTYGGRVDVAEEIVHMLLKSPVPTVTLVDRNAISAGAIIALATDRIYMVPGSRIGDAMPVMMTPFGGVQEMPEALSEKQTSFVTALIRSAAQQKGHDPKLAEAMVRRDTEFTVGGEVISVKGRLLTLTDAEAARPVDDGTGPRPLLSAGTVDGLDALLRQLGRDETRLVRLEVTATERIARFIEAISVLLLAGGLLGLYIEFKTPGFGLPGVLGLLLLAIWFWGHHIAGLSGAAELFVFLAGVALLLAEIFLIPGFGAAGIAGIVLVLTSLLMAMVPSLPGLPWWPPALPSFRPALRDLLLALCLVFAAGALIGRYLPGIPGLRRLVLAAATDGAAGYRAAEDTSSLVGSQGVTLTRLNPAGVAMFGDRRLDVMAEGEFVPAGSRVRIARAEGSRVFVERMA